MIHCRWCGEKIQVRPDGHTWEVPGTESTLCGLGRHEPDRGPAESPFTKAARERALPSKDLRI